jgi:hypothetical protein
MLDGMAVSAKQDKIRKCVIASLPERMAVVRMQAVMGPICPPT